MDPCVASIGLKIEWAKVTDMKKVEKTLVTRKLLFHTARGFSMQIDGTNFDSASTQASKWLH
jgi:hypothetical protein